VSKIVLIGSGAVGSTFAYTVLLRGLCTELVIIDVNRDKAEGDVLDLNHGLMLANPMKIRVGDYPDCADADMIVVTAGAAQRPGETRIDLMGRNVAIFKSIISGITAYTNTSILLIATNPVDILTQVALKLSGWPSHRVIGSGTLLDSSRFRYLVGQKLGVDPRSIHGVIIGEHGDSEVAVMSLLQVGGVKLDASSDCSGLCLSDEEKREIIEETRTAAYKIIQKKGATFYAIALALARICEAILKDQRSVLTVSSYLQNYHGISDVCLSVPTILGRNGVEAVLPLPLAPDEEKAFQESANTLKSFLQEIGF